MKSADSVNKVNQTARIPRESVAGAAGAGV